MAYGTLKSDVVQSSTAGTPPQFNDGNGTQTGTLCRAWVNFNGTGAVAIRASFNVSSITDNGTGDYTVNFTNALPDANYVVSGSAALNGTGSGGSLNAARFIGQYSATTSACRVVTCYANITQDDPAYVQIAIFR
ncbi:MAG: hypothetical protein ACR2IJ_11210 [Fluviibacter sp.]